jgi:hypothetical protein
VAVVHRSRADVNNNSIRNLDAAGGGEVSAEDFFDCSTDPAHYGSLEQLQAQCASKPSPQKVMARKSRVLSRTGADAGSSSNNSREGSGSDSEDGDSGEDDGVGVASLSLLFDGDYSSGDEGNVSESGSDGGRAEEVEEAAVEADALFRDLDQELDDEEDEDIYLGPAAAVAPAAASVVILDGMTLSNGRMQVLDQPWRLERAQLLALQRRQLEVYGYHNTHVVAVLEMDDARFFRAQRLSVGQKGRRTMYVFATQTPGEAGNTTYALRTYQEWKSEFAVSKGYETGSANADSTSRNTFVRRWLQRRRQEQAEPASGSLLAMRCRNTNYARTSDAEQRRQDLDNSYRTLLKAQCVALHKQQNAHRDEVEEAERRGMEPPAPPSPDFARRKGGKGLFGRRRGSVRSDRDGNDSIYSPDVHLRSVSSFLATSPHSMAELLSKPPHGGGVGSRKLRTGIAPFVLESYCCVQLGSFFWSQEYLGLTADELVFIKPASRMGVSKRITLPLLSLKAVQSVDNCFLPFTLGDTRAFSVSTFSRVFLVLVQDGQLRDQWIDQLQDMIAETRDRTRLQSTGSYADNRHLDMLVKTKGYDVEADSHVLNARSFTTGSLCAYVDNREDAWPVCDIPFYLTHPHVLVQKLLRLAFRLAAAAADDIDMGDALSEKLWVDFLNGAALLQRVDMSIYDCAPSSQGSAAVDSAEEGQEAESEGAQPWEQQSALLDTSGPAQDWHETNSEDAKLSLLLNLYHVMVLHSFLVAGLPDSEDKYNSIFDNYCYEAFGDCFSIRELEALVLHRGLLSHASASTAYVMNNYMTGKKPAPASGGDLVSAESSSDSSSSTLAFKMVGLGASLSRVPGRLSRAVGLESGGHSLDSIADDEAFFFALSHNRDLRLLFVLNTGHRTLPSTVPIFTPHDLGAQLDRVAESVLHCCLSVGNVTMDDTEKEAVSSRSRSRSRTESAGNAAVPLAEGAGGQQQHALYLSGALPGAEGFLKLLSKMKVLFGGDDGDGPEATSMQRVVKAVRRRSQLQQLLSKAHQGGESEGEGGHDSALALLSRGMHFSGDRNFVAFMLQHVRAGSDLRAALAGSIRAHLPKTPAIKASKLAISSSKVAFRFLEESRAA